MIDFKNYDEMLNNVFSDIFRNCIGYTLYAHNLSSFDGLLIIKNLYKLFDVKPLFKDNKIMSFEVSKTIIENGKKKILKFILRCSLKMLPLLLNKLINSFGIDIPKLPFPYNFFFSFFFLNKNNLDYNNSLPEYKYYKEDLTYDNDLEMYQKFSNNNWNIRNETIKYINNDINYLY